MRWVRVIAGLLLLPLAAGLGTADAATLVGDGSTVPAVEGLRPGTPLYIQFDEDRTRVEICTANFLWKDQRGDLWLGAAGHCFLKGVTNNQGRFDLERVEVFACRSVCAGGLTGSQVFFDWQAGGDHDFVELGQVGYARQNGVGEDFGLVAVPAEIVDGSSPEAPGGGPYGVATPAAGAALMFHGNGIAVGEATHDRIGVLQDIGQESWTMSAIINGGDSGAGVLTAERAPLAVGILTHGHRDDIVGLTPSSADAYGTTIAQAQAMANEVGLCVRLVLAFEDPATAAAAPRTVACADDEDGDGVLDWDDQCPGFDDSADLDGDGTPDGCDEDRDGDRVANGDDAFPGDASEWADSDGDGVGDNSDACPGHDDGLDMDGDGVPNHCDDDVDGDGRENWRDNDSDADGHSDGNEQASGSDPFDPASVPARDD